MNRASAAPRRSLHRNPLPTSIAALAMIITGGCTDNNESAEAPPERDFDSSAAWSRMEEAAAEAIAELPDFPGFEERRMLELSCKHNREVNNYCTRFELTYMFSAEDSATELVHEDYVDLLREQWTEADYDVHRDESRGEDPVFHDLEATRPDGINYWLIAANYTSLVVQSGCVKRNGGSECPPPLGGVTEENDIAGRQACGGLYDEPPEEADAIAPFDGTQAAMTPFRSGNAEELSIGSPWLEGIDPRCGIVLHDIDGPRIARLRCGSPLPGRC